MKGFMSNRAWAIVIAVCLQCAALAQGESTRADNNSSDEAALNEVIKKYYAAYAGKNLWAMVKLWSERSPDLVASIDRVDKSLTNEEYAFSNLALARIRLADNKAVLQVMADITATNIQTKAARQEQMSRSFAMIKEKGEWKVWRDAPASEDLSAFLEKGAELKVSGDSAEHLANEIMNAKSDAERSRLLAENKSAMTVKLRDALIRKVGPLEIRGDYPQTITLLRIAVAISEQIDDKQGVADAERHLGNMFRLAGQYQTAVEHYQSAIARFDAIGNRSEKAAALADIGVVHFTEQKYALAIEFFQKALAEYEALKDNTGIANALEQIASVHYDQENFDTALGLFERVLKLREATGRKAEIAATVNSIGNVYFQQEDYIAAVASYQQAIAGFIEVKHNEAVAATTSNIAAAHYSSGNYDAAIENYQRAYKLEEQLRSKRGQADALVKMAKVYSALGNYSLTIESLRRGVDGYTTLRDRSKAAVAQAELGEAYYQIRNYTAALEHYEKSLATHIEMNSNADAGTILAAIGSVHYLQGSYNLALESYQKAITHYEALKHAAGVAGLNGSIASTHHTQGKSDLALELYQKSLSQFEALGDKPRIASTLEAIASVHYTRGDYAKSLEVAALAATLADQVKSLDTLWRVRLIEGMNYRALAQPDKARESFEQSVKIIEAMREQVVRGEQRRFFQSKTAPMLALFESLIAQEKVFDAFGVAERIKNGLLWDVLQSGGARINKQMTTREQEQERKFESDIISLKARINRERQRRQPNAKRLADLDARLEKAVADYRAFEETVYAAHPQLRAMRAESLPLKAEDLGRLLPDNSTALLEFVVTDSRAYLLAITREEPRQKERQDADKAARRSDSAPQASTLLNAYVLNTTRGELSERIMKLREMIAARDEKAQLIARELYELLLRPADEQLKSRTAWVIVPDATLWQLPFHALQPAEGRFLIEDRAISYAPSLTAFDEIMKHATAADAQTVGPTILAVGNPLISLQTIERIKLMSEEAPEPSPGTESEVKALEQLYGAVNARARVGRQASEEVVKEQAGKSSVAHLAAPALLDDASPMYSHVALSHSEESGAEDGLLEAWEMMKQNLASRLVVLPASAAAKKTITGDAMAAWSWALFVAGCPTTVVGQWKTDAASTTEFMIEFHRSLKWKHPAASRGRARQNVKAEIGVAQALRQAALKLIRGGQRRHPFYWASFRVIGDGR